MNELFTTNDEQHSITKKSHPDTYTSTLMFYTENYATKTKKGIYEFMNACIEQKIFRSDTKEKCLGNVAQNKLQKQCRFNIKGGFDI